jgi:hypothetical protein
LEKRKPTDRAKWRSSLSECRGVRNKVLDSADIVRDGDFAPTMTAKAILGCNDARGGQNGGTLTTELCGGRLCVELASVGA